MSLSTAKIHVNLHAWNRAGAVLVAAAVTATLGLAGGPAAAAATPADPGSFEVDEAEVWSPSAVNTTASGELPEGEWAPPVPAEDEVGLNERQMSRSMAVDDPFPGSGAGGESLGLQPFYATETFDLTDRVSATVNLATGNLVLRSTDVQLNAPGLTLRLDTFHNSLADGDGALGPNVLMSTGHDVGLDVATDTVTFYGPSGFTGQYEADGSGGWEMPPGVNADLVQNSDDTWTLTYRSSGEELTFTEGGFLIEDVDRNGVGLSLAYNADNQVESITDGAGRVTTLTYGTSGRADGKLEFAEDPYGRTTQYAYTFDGKLAGIIYPNDARLRLTPNGDGRISRLQTPRGAFIDFTYDSTGRVTEVERFVDVATTTGQASVTSFAYPSATETTQTSPIGGTTTYTFDSLGRATNVEDPLGNERSQTWTPNSDIATATDAMGTGGVGAGVTEYTYDEVNNLTAVAAPTGAATQAAYGQGDTCDTTDTDHPYQAKCLTDDAGNTTSLTYDTPGNVTSVEDTSDGGGAVTRSFTYQSEGTGGTQCGGKPGQTCSSTDGRGNTTNYTYNSVGDLIKIEQPSPLGDTTMTYDSASRLAAVTDGEGQTTSYQYDGLDRLTRTEFDNTSQRQNAYDPDGNLYRSTDSAHGSDDYTYDALGRETSRDLSGMSSPYTTGYDLAGNVTSVTDPQGHLTYTYNDANQLTRMTEPGPIHTDFTYDANGAETARTFPNGVTQTTDRDASGRATRITATDAADTVLTDLSYSYTAVGTGSAEERDRSKVQTRTDHDGLAGLPAGAITSYAYDTLNRVTGVDENTSTGTDNAAWTYAYDESGNRTSQTRTGNTGATAGTTTYGYNAADQLTSRNGSTTGWAYNANGDQTSSPDWGTTDVRARNEVSSITKGATTTNFSYLGIGNTTRTAAGDQAYTNGSLGITAQTAGGQTEAFRRTPDGSLVSYRQATGARSYYLTDNLGSVIALTNTSGTITAEYAYDPYGNPRATGTSASSNPLRYTGGYLDTATGLYKFGARYYDPETGRFTQQDPSGQEANTYLYAAGDPCNNVDPTGLRSDPTGAGTIACGKGLVTGAVGGFISGAVVGSITGPGALVVGTATALGGALGGCAVGIIGEAW
ncbi:RHS repeat domain-containing protein [Aquipuribacter sp. MA13-6]|uniref:RHS repeat domain-containing protein n=1 Tax=unclassified Aquipuribacter TaxID=2635084 RepID=UPI003EEC2532